MPKIAADRLEKMTAMLLQGAGATAQEAAIIAKHVIGANLAGHDSHGIIQILEYIARMKKNHIVPGAEFDILRETPATTVVDGHWGFGYVISERAMEITIEKALKNGVAATTVRRQSHVGRVADYTIMAAKQGLIGMMAADSGRGPKRVAPFGGREPRLGTNPISIAMPSNLKGPFFIDMATSAAAAGKFKVAIARGLSIPEGWVIDKDGNATTDPNALNEGGVILPLGGPEGHKGYGLSAMIEIFSGILTGLGFGVEPTGRHNDGVFMAAFKVDAFRDLETFKQEITDFANYLTATPKASGVDRIYYPGEVEYLRTQINLNEGINVEEKTWAKLEALAAEYGVSWQIDIQG